MTTSLDRTQRRCGVVLLVGMTVALLALGGRLIQINTTLHARLTALAKSQQRGTSVIPARRGTIFDARGRIVALSRQKPDVFVDPSLVKDVESLAQDLAARINVPATDIARAIRLHPSSRYVTIAPHVDPVTAWAVRSMQHRAVGLLDRAHRSYPLGSSMAHVLGWVGQDDHGQGGIELAYDDYLRGRDGHRGTIRDARRRALRRSPSSTILPVDGGHVVLTLDAEIQRITEDALQRGVSHVHAQSGIAIAMSPYTGEVLSLACQPTFDPNDPVTPESLGVRRNRVVTDPVEPGSTMKPIVACGALDGGYVSLTEKIDCHMGSHRFGRRLVHDSSPHGLLDLRGIISHSSNIGMGQIGERMGNQALYQTVRRFGFGDRTGIECPGESNGLVHPLKRWGRLSKTSIPIGYEILVTPLQLITAFAAIINDGILLKPRLVKMLLDPSGRIVESFDAPQVVRRAASSHAARFMTEEALPAVVEEGGGWRARVGPYRVLGKTGTPKLLLVDRSGYEPRAYLGLFVGAAPTEHPRVVVLVMIRRPDPRIGYYGGKVAAPVAGRILADILAYWGVLPDETEARVGL